jgi:hypothetical protein
VLEQIYSIAKDCFTKTLTNFEQNLWLDAIFVAGSAENEALLNIWNTLAVKFIDESHVRLRVEKINLLSHTLKFPFSRQIHALISKTR